jgi:DNA-binding transcriptional LysR family regulator
VADIIEVDLKRAVVALETTRDCERAAGALAISEAELRRRVSALEDLLCVYLFRPGAEPPSPTDEGVFLIQEMRQWLDRHDRTESAKNDLDAK